jgi:uncharacterized DUF497 family protein
MMSDAFEWDDTKAAENYAKHGVSFELAAKVFRDPLASNDWMTARTMARIASS